MSQNDKYLRIWEQILIGTLKKSKSLKNIYITKILHHNHN